MSRLLSAGLSRLLRCKIFWLACIVMAAFEAGEIINCRYDGRALDSVFFYFAFPAGLLSAVVTAFLIGPEYGDGTMRNKIITGCRRRDVYISNLCVSSLAAVFMCAVGVFVGVALGVPLCGGLRTRGVDAAMLVFGVIVMSLAYASIHTLVMMLLPNRTVSSVAVILIAFMLIVSGSYINDKLAEGPKSYGYGITSSGEPDVNVFDNPDYIAPGPVRDVLEFLDDASPGGQSGHYALVTAQRPVLMMAYSAGIFLIAAIVGVMVFEKKDLR